MIDFMKTKTLALVNGIVSLVGGIYLFLFVLFASFSVAIFGGEEAGFWLAVMVGTLLKIAALTLGILSLVYYKGDERVSVASGVLLIVGGAVGLIPLMGWVGGILLIIGGAFYLASLKKFDQAS